MTPSLARYGKGQKVFEKGSSGKIVRLDSAKGQQQLKEQGSAAARVRDIIEAARRRESGRPDLPG
jgi:hypothetical protein